MVVQDIYFVVTNSFGLGKDSRQWRHDPEKALARTEVS